MSKNISNLSGRIGLKDNLFKKMSENVLNDSPKDIKEIAKEYNLGVSTIHGAESFYEFLRPSHRKKKAFVCNGSACMCAGTCLLYTSPSPRDRTRSRMPSSA